MESIWVANWCRSGYRVTWSTEYSTPLLLSALELDFSFRRGAKQDLSDLLENCLRRQIELNSDLGRAQLSQLILT